MKTSSGFTVVELLMAVLFLGILLTVGFDRYQAVQTVHRDQDRKIAINAIYSNLEEVVKPSLNGYPRILNAAQLTAMDKKLLIDPKGARIGDARSDYRYEPTGCSGGDICRAFTLRANLEKEADYIKTSVKN